MNSISRLNGALSTASPVLGPELIDCPNSVVPPDTEVAASSSRRRFSVAYKQRIIREAEGCRGTGQIAALLRREGLYSSHLATWRKQLALAPRQRGRKPTDPALSAQIEQNRKLTRENARLERRLAQAEAIIDIQKKVSALLGIPLNQGCTLAEGPDSEGSD